MYYLHLTVLLSTAQVMILITGAHKAFALYKAIEEGVNHMWTVSAFQQHPRTIFVCDEDATLELRVKTVKYFKGTNDTDLSFFCQVENSLEKDTSALQINSHLSVLQC